MDLSGDEKLVSVIIPVYNSKMYIEMCLASVLEQDYKKLQIIIVDDGSTDGSGDICDRYALLDSRVEVIHTVNGGSVKARKEGLKIAVGDYVGFVDSDDYIDSNMISTLVDELEKNEADFVHSGYKEIKGDFVSSCINFKNETIRLEGNGERKEFIKKYLLDIKNNATISYSIWSKLFKRDLVTKCFFSLDDRKQLGEDAICLFRCVLESRRIALLPVALYNYRILHDSLSHGDARTVFPKQVLLCAEIIDVLYEYGVDRDVDYGLYDFLQSSLLPVIKADDERKFLINQYYLNDICQLKGARVAIYGAGAVGQDIYQQLVLGSIDVVCVVDSNPKRRLFDGREVTSPKTLKECEFDCVLIAVAKEDVAVEIKEVLVSDGINSEIIKWICPNRYY